jgi:hypothetical protein
VRLANPAHYLEFGELVAEDPVEGIRRAENALAMASVTLDVLASPLPEHPDPAPAEAWLRRVRRQLLDATESPPR